VRLELVDTPQSLADNVREYQIAAKKRDARVTPNLVRSWYYIPALDMVGGSRFIGYKGMTAELYDRDDIYIDGRETEPHLQSTGWFAPLNPGDPKYTRAVALAESLSRTGKIWLTARFHVLKERYNSQVK
jgi:hypothetical protein